MKSSTLTNPSAIRSNRAGEITEDQANDLTDRLGSPPGWFSLGVMALLFVLVALVAGRTLANSTPLALAAGVLIILVSVAITSWISGIMGRQRLARITVEPSPGTVVWQKNQYVAQSAGRTLQPITSNMNLDPGDYTFYIAHGTNWMLSAEPASMAGQLDTPPNLDELKAILKKPIDFDPSQSPEESAQRVAEIERAMKQLGDLDPSRVSSADRQEFVDLARRTALQMEKLVVGQGSFRDAVQLMKNVSLAPDRPLDSHGVEELKHALEQAGAAHPSALEANRQQKLTAHQRAALFSDLSAKLLWMIVAVPIALFLLYLGFSKQEYMIMLVVVALLLLAELLLLGRVRADLFDWMGGHAVIEEGVVSKYSRTSNSSRGHSTTYYYYRVNQVSLEVWRSAYDALLEGRSYRLYITPRTRKLLNIELVEPQPA